MSIFPELLQLLQERDKQRPNDLGVGRLLHSSTTQVSLGCSSVLTMFSFYMNLISMSAIGELLYSATRLKHISLSL